MNAPQYSAVRACPFQPVRWISVDSQNVRANVDRTGTLRLASQQGLREQKDSVEPATRWARTDIDAEQGNHARSIAHGCERFLTHRPSWSIARHEGSRCEKRRRRGVIVQQAGVEAAIPVSAPGLTMIGAAQERGS